MSSVLTSYRRQLLLYACLSGKLTRLKNCLSRYGLFCLRRSRGEEPSGSTHWPSATRVYSVTQPNKRTKAQKERRLIYRLEPLSYRGSDITQNKSREPPLIEERVFCSIMMGKPDNTTWTLFVGLSDVTEAISRLLADFFSVAAVKSFDRHIKKFC